MNAKPRRYISGFKLGNGDAVFETEFGGDLKVIYGQEPGTVIFECEVMQPKSSRGRTIYVYFQENDLTDAMKLLRSEAIRARSQPMEVPQ